MRFKQAQIRTDMNAYLVTHISVISANLGIYAADLNPKRLARPRDAIVLGLRARNEMIRAQGATGISVTTAVFRAMTWIPEPLTAAKVWPVIATTCYEGGIFVPAY